MVTSRAEERRRRRRDSLAFKRITEKRNLQARREAYAKESL